MYEHVAVTSCFSLSLRPTNNAVLHHSADPWCAPLLNCYGFVLFFHTILKIKRLILALYSLDLNKQGVFIVLGIYSAKITNLLGTKW